MEEKLSNTSSSDIGEAHVRPGLLMLTVVSCV